MSSEDFMADVMTVTTRKRVVTDYRVTIDGHTFDGDDLYSTLLEVEESDIHITDQTMVLVLKKIGVIEHEGSQRWLTGAKTGRNYVAFVEALREKLNKVRDDDDD